MDSLAYTLFGGFAMALADSVSGLPGGTAAFCSAFVTGSPPCPTRSSTARGTQKARNFFRRCGQKRAFALKYAPQEDEL